LKKLIKGKVMNKAQNVLDNVLKGNIKGAVDSAGHAINSLVKDVLGDNEVKKRALTAREEVGVLVLPSQDFC
jgi:hypothetical protein